MTVLFRVLWYIDGNKLTFDSKGSGGLPELREKLDGSRDRVYFGGIKVVGIDARGSTESRRTKLIAFTYVGPEVGVLKKAKVSVQRNEVQKVTKGIACALDAHDNTNDLSSTAVATLLLKAGAAHKPTQYDFGGGETFDIQLNE